ncbi:M56 family metallopeptidase [Polaribacter pacificus]|uniref:M56 family metallopeptidase n=1 Tax=Polaribacter pacificus TaxID=1775173 RepID=UPI00166450F1|nr:M56 family metallopeptidase [Polaribacter pacificus]
MHQFNRWYLLGSILVSFLIPSYIIYVPATAAENFIGLEQQQPQQQPVTDIAFLNTVSIDAPAQVNTINYEVYLSGLYILISSILAFIFIKSIYKIIAKVRKNERLNYYSATVILLKEEILPHTFLSYIFLNKQAYVKDQSEQLILTHELAHVKQKHSIDIIFIELLHLVFWIVPIFKWYKKAIQLNHEFLADQAVLNTHNNISEYQNLLLQLTTQNNSSYLASNLNYSLTKKRLLMMTTPSSKTKILIKKLLVVPVVAGFIFAFAQRVEAKQNEKPQVKEIKKLTTNLSEEDLYRDYVYKNVILKYTDKNGNKIEKSYPEMTPEEKKMLGSPMPLLFKKKIPSEKIISDLKNSEKYAIWINEKVVDNSILDTYTNSDFSSYFISFVYKNARSERFPQEYQAHLTTNDFFETRNNKRVRDFEDYKEKRKKDPNYRGETSKKQPMIFFKSLNSPKKEKKENVATVKKNLPPPMDTIYTYKHFVKKIQAAPKTGKPYMTRIKQMYKEMTPKQRDQVIEPSLVLPKPEVINVNGNKDSNKRQLAISISPEGFFSINTDDTFKTFEPISLASIEELLSKLSTNEIKNTFVFAKSKDLNKFRSKPSNSKEYQDDIEINLFKSKIKIITLKENGNDLIQVPYIQYVLDNKDTKLVKPHVQKLAIIFKKYGITNMTI